MIKIVQLLETNECVLNHTFGGISVWNLSPLRDTSYREQVVGITCSSEADVFKRRHSWSVLTNYSYKRVYIVLNDRRPLDACLKFLDLELGSIYEIRFIQWEFI